ncbi:SDR family NAD(P)-dependent oxidoreductase [Paucilactobacillus sp. N302-9]
MSKLILITGATDGIGKVTAQKLAEKGHEIIIHGRNEQKAQHVVSEIKQATGNQKVSYLIADLFSFQAIKDMVNNFNDNHDHLDVLINNAGAVLDAQRFETVNGIEGTMALNVMAPLLLTELLLPKLRHSSDGRIINMSSGTHRIAHPDMTDLNLEHVASGQVRYGISKLFVIWNTQHLAAQLQQAGISNITVNVSHPGMATTNFGQDSDNGFWVNLVYKVAVAIGKTFHVATPEQGAVTNVYLASADNVKGVSGKFFDNKKRQVQPATGEYSPAKELALWNYCMKKLQPWIDEN